MEISLFYLLENHLGSLYLYSSHEQCCLEVYDDLGLYNGLFVSEDCDIPIFMTGNCTPVNIEHLGTNDVVTMGLALASLLRQALLLYS